MPQPHQSINIANCAHRAALTCKLEQVLWSGHLTYPVIKLIFPKTSSRSCWGSQYLFPLSVHINRSLSILNSSQQGRRKWGCSGWGGWWHRLPCGRPPRSAVTGSSITTAAPARRGARIFISPLCLAVAMCLKLHTETLWLSFAVKATGDVTQKPGAAVSEEQLCHSTKFPDRGRRVHGVWFMRSLLYVKGLWHTQEERRSQSRDTLLTKMKKDRLLL